jgi:hypothetical protein
VKFLWWGRFVRYTSSGISTTARSIRLKIGPPVSLGVGKLWFKFRLDRSRIEGVATISSILSLVVVIVFGGVLARWPKLVEEKSPKMANFFKKRDGFPGKEGNEE